MVRCYVAGSIYNESSIFREEKNKTLDYNSSINFSKVSFRANLDINITRTTTLSVNLATVSEKKNSPGRAGELVFERTATGDAALGFERGNGGNRINYFEASLSYDRLFGEKYRVAALFLFDQCERNNIVPADAISSLPYRSQGIAGRVTYAFNDGYFADEKFWGDLGKTVDVFKLKASYGVVGNDNIGGSRRFIYEETVKTNASTFFGQRFCLL